MARSLDSARLRAESRVQRFLDAAIELFNSRSGKDFTVQEVVELSGQSLHSFYQYFGGKHELLLALSRRRSARPPTGSGKRSRRRATRSSVCTASWSSTTGSAVRPSTLTPARRAGSTSWPSSSSSCSPSTRRRRPGSSPPWPSLFEEVLDEAAAAGSVRPGLRHGPDRRHRARGDHVQCVLLDHRGPFAAPQRGRHGRGSVEPDPARDRDRPHLLSVSRRRVGAAGHRRMPELE